jgi:type II secretory pathway predicted ATPase ExeA
MDMGEAQAWIAIIGVVFTGLTTLLTLVFAALASRDSKRAAEVTQQSRVALSEVHTVVNENFSKQREEIAAQAKQIAYLVNQLSSSKEIADKVETTRVTLAAEAAKMAGQPQSEGIIKP